MSSVSVLACAAVSSAALHSARRLRSAYSVFKNSRSAVLAFLEIESFDPASISTVM